jgi:hypothetical protein
VRAHERESDEAAPATKGPGAVSAAGGGVGLGGFDVVGLQRTVGNAPVSRLLQRHAAGIPPPVDEATAKAELETPPDTEGVPLVDEASKTKTSKKPVKPEPKTMDAAAAQTALQGAYGSVHTITSFTIVWLKDQNDAWAQYDKQNIGLTNPNTTPPSKWKKGDAKKLLPGLAGWADAPNSKVYLLKRTALPTATAHEMLHMNTAADFRDTCGEALNEGTTEHLAIKALNKAGIATSGSGVAVAYPDQVKMVQKVIKIVGEAALIDAYFNGAQKLVNAIDALEGPGAFAKLKGAGTLATGHADAVLKDKTPSDKINLINGHLNDPLPAADITAIGLIWDSNPADQPAIRNGLPGTPGVHAKVEGLVSSHLTKSTGATDADAIKKLADLPITDKPTLTSKVCPRIIELINGHITEAADPADMTAIDALVDLPVADKARILSATAVTYTNTISALLSKFVVKDEHLAAIERLAATKAADLATIGPAVAPKVEKLWFKAKKARAKAALKI